MNAEGSGESAGGALLFQGGEAGEDFRGVFGFGERGELGGDVAPVEAAVAGADDGHANIAPVLLAGGEGFHDDEVFGGADAEGEAFGVGDVAGTCDDALLERESPEGDVEAGAVFGAEEEDAVLEGEGPGIGTAGLVALEESVYIQLLAAESGEEGHVGVIGEPWLGEGLDGEAANEAELPLVLLTEMLEGEGGGDEVRHAGRSLA